MRRREKDYEGRTRKGWRRREKEEVEIKGERKRREKKCECV